MGKSEKKKKSSSKKRHHSSDEEYAEHRDRKKSHKKAEKIAKVFGYSNDINPFGDSNLLQPFVWGKKQEKEKKQGKVSGDPEAERLKLMTDIEKVRKRRLEREQELEEMERLRTEEMRLREAAQYGDWMKKEEEYHIEQTKVRSKIRLIEGREKPVDLLAKNILIVENILCGGDKKSRADAISLARLEADISDPVDMLESGDLSTSELEDFINDSDNYLQLEIRKEVSGGQSSYRSFWQCLKDIAAAQRKKQKLKSQEGMVGSNSRGSHKAIEDDVRRIFHGKSASELEVLNKEILAGVQNGTRTDVEYWEAMAEEALLESKRIKARDVYSSIVTKKLDILHDLKEDIEASESTLSSERRQGDVAAPEGTDYRFLPSASSSRPHTIPDFEDQAGLGTGGEVDTSEASLALEKSEAEKFSKDSAEEKMKQTDEVQLPGQSHQWMDKYRPRKPRYFNRVRTGYDWNKYNATHYDHDNPPPKLVLGYKFNIFYPDLIDKTTTPQYFIERCDEPGFAVIRFHSGAPYEDIAFKLVSKQWDTNRRSGFRCVFERGVLQLHFNFKRHWYRR